MPGSRAGSEAAQTCIDCRNGTRDPFRRSRRPQEPVESWKRRCDMMVSNRMRRRGGVFLRRTARWTAPAVHFSGAAGRQLRGTSKETWPRIKPRKTPETSRFPQGAERAGCSRRSSLLQAYRFPSCSRSRCSCCRIQKRSFDDHESGREGISSAKGDVAMEISSARNEFPGNARQSL